MLDQPPRRGPADDLRTPAGQALEQVRHGRTVDPFTRVIAWDQRKPPPRPLPPMLWRNRVMMVARTLISSGLISSRSSLDFDRTIS